MSKLVQVQVKNNIGTIEDNLEAVEAAIRSSLEEYKNVVVTEDSVADGKKFVAQLRKDKKALDDDRKAIKNAWMEPYLRFEERAKKIIALYDEPVALINGQVQAFAEQEKEAKKILIAEIYDNVKFDQYADWLPLQRIYNPKWENKTYRDSMIASDIDMEFQKLSMAVDTIKSLRSEYEEDALKKLRETLNIQEAIAEINRMKEAAERLAEIQRQKEEDERLKREALEQEKVKMEQEAEEVRVSAPEVEIPSELPSQDLGAADAAGMYYEPSINGEETVPDDGFTFEKERIFTVRAYVGENVMSLFTEFCEKNGIQWGIEE